LLTTTSGELRKLRMSMRPKHPRDRLLVLNTSGVHDLVGSFTSRLRRERLVPLGYPARGQSRAFYSFVTACRGSKSGLRD
jgi:hypothetical protein